VPATVDPGVFGVARNVVRTMLDLVAEPLPLPAHKRSSSNTPAAGWRVRKGAFCCPPTSTRQPL
jgi:hypothetical protein